MPTIISVYSKFDGTRSLESTPGNGYLASIVLAGLGLAVILACWCFGLIRSCCSDPVGHSHAHGQPEEVVEQSEADKEKVSVGRLQTLFEVTKVTMVCFLLGLRKDCVVVSLSCTLFGN